MVTAHVYVVGPTWIVGASQFGIRAVSCQPTSLRLTSLLQRPKDDVGWCLSLMVATRAMPPKRRRAPIQDVNLATQLNELRQMMLAQQQEIGGLRAQLAQQNQGPPDAEVPPAPLNQPATPEIPYVDPVIPENPIAPEVPVVPVAVPPAPLVRTPEELYDRFRRMKAPEFEGSTNSIEVDNWLIDLQVALNFLRLNDQEKVLCVSFMLRKDARLWWETVQLQRDVTEMTWEDFVEEFKEKYFNTEVMEAQQDEFDKFRQGNLSVAEAVKKFEQLARLCPHLISSERDKVRRMMRMFRPDLAVDKIRSNELSFSRRRGKKRPKLSKTRPSKAKPHNRKVKEDLQVKTTTGSMTATNKKGSGMQEDRGINRIFPRRRILLIATVIPLVRNVGEGTREIAVLETVAVFYVARKATMLETAISIPRVRRTNREDMDLNFTLHR
ncbi:hypothetical protein TIFTF001_048433 [Ficus carica]|uniref:Retrotransposon gag domain-containing protein n=1 Tax=Ficus carica TaxID=3494 RepID=A0AA87ZIX1_FICCA|nr:hypothetical protein TIFTF001_048433 [Ficus carica]